MSADYYRLFHSPDAVRTVDEDPDREAALAGGDSPAPLGGSPRSDVSAPPMPIAPPRTQTAPAPPPQQTEVTSQITADADHHGTAALPQQRDDAGPAEHGALGGAPRAAAPRPSSGAAFGARAGTVSALRRQ